MRDQESGNSRPAPRPKRQVERYTDLTVWQTAMDLADAVYEATGDFPRQEAFGLTSQLRRASVSIPSNIAEGWGRGRTKEYVQFLRYARGSLYEVETQLRITERRGFLASDTLASLLVSTVEISKMLSGLMRALQRS